MQLRPDQRQSLSLICSRYHVQRLQMFGSAAVGTMNDDSDVDLLIEFLPGHAPGAFALVDLQDELSATFDQRPVDLAFPSVLRNPYRRRTIAPQLQPLYEAREPG